MAENTAARRMIILSGPSCVGKGPLLRAFNTHFPDFDYRKVVLYNSRAPRPGEVEGYDYRYRSVADIERMTVEDRNRYVTGWVRDDFQALDLREIRESREPVIFLELHYTLVDKLKEQKEFFAENRIDVRTVFMSPLSPNEIETLRSLKVDLRTFIPGMMLPRQIRRANNQGRPLTPALLGDIYRRIHDTYGEMQRAYRFDHILINHDGEDSDNWQFPYPLGEAGRTLEAFAQMMLGGECPSHRWYAGLLP